MRVKINYNIIGVILRGIFGFIGNITYFYIVYYAAKAEVNFSVISCIFSLTPFVTSLGFYIFFKESVKKVHLFGMFFLLLCIIILSYS